MGRYSATHNHILYEIGYKMRARLTNIQKSLPTGEIIFWMVLVVIAAAGIILLRYITPYGMGLVNDSVGYIAGARNLLAGNGYSRLTGDANIAPITNYPPLFSIVMAACGLFGLEAVRAARFINLLCFGGNSILTGMAVRKISGSRILALVGALFFIIGENFLWTHAFALTEPLYLFFSYLVLLLAVRYFEVRTRQDYETDHPRLTNDHGNDRDIGNPEATGKRTWMLLAGAGLLASLAFLTRYVGISLYVTTALGLLFFRKSWKKHITDGALFILFGSPLVIAWSVRNALITGNPANRNLVFHPIPAYKFQEGIQNFWQWLLPNRFVQVETPFSIWGAATGLLLIILAAATVWLVIRYHRQSNTNSIQSSLPAPATAIFHQSPHAAIVFAVQGTIYLSLLVFTLTYLDSSPIFEHRILSPFYICLLVIGFGLSSRLWKRYQAPIIKTSVAVIFAGLTISFCMDSLSLSQELHQYGQGFLSYRWQNSAALQVVKTEIPEEITLFSNTPNALYLLADRPSYSVLSPVNPATTEERPGYWDVAENIRNAVKNQEAVLVLFDYRAYLENPQDSYWVEKFTEGLPLYGEYWDGAIFGIPPY